MAPARNFLDEGSSREQSLDSASASLSRLAIPLVELTCCCCKWASGREHPLLSWLPALKLRDPLVLKEVSALVGGGVEKTPAKLCLLNTSTVGEAARDSSQWLEMEEIGLSGGLVLFFTGSCVWPGSVWMRFSGRLAGTEVLTGLLNALILKLCV